MEDKSFEELKETYDVLKTLENTGIAPLIDYIAISIISWRFIKEKGLEKEFEEWSRKHEVEILNIILDDLIKLLTKAKKIIKEGDM